MLLRKTIRARVFKPTNRKQKALESLLVSWKQALRMPRDYRTLRERTDLPSYYCREMAWKVAAGANAPIGLPRDSFDLVPGRSFAQWFVSIPTVEGRVRLPLRMSMDHADLLGEARVRDSLVVEKRSRFYLHLVVEREVPDPVVPSEGPVLAVDIGERVLAASVALVRGRLVEPRFHGRQVRSIRRHHAWLRLRFGERKLLRMIKRMGEAERRKVTDLLHKISRAIVDQAARLGAVIAIGDLSGIRKRRVKGRRFRRIVSSLPYGRLSAFIEYKAAWAGLVVLYVGEAYSSRECHICHEWGRRPTQGHFVCSGCGEYNADLNGATNIGKRALAYMAIAGAPGFEPKRRTSRRDVS